MSAGDNVTLTLICVACGTSRIIQVPHERGVQAGWHFWECLECQAKGARGAGRPWKRQERQGHKAETQDTEET